MNPKDLTILIADPWYYGDDLVAAIMKAAPGCRVVSPEQFKLQPDLVNQADIVFGRIDKSLYPGAARLKWHQCPFDGMEWSNCPEVRDHPVVLTNARFHAGSVSEQLFGLLLMLVRGLHLSVRHAPQWHRPVEQLDTLGGKTLCVLGLGVIGRRCAMLGKAFGMRVIGVNRSGRAAEGVEKVFPPGQLLAALAEAHVVMNLLPLTTQTAGLIGDREFAAMPPGGYFLNAGRGKTVQTDALVRALSGGHLKAAGLDVVDPEPLPPEHPLWTMPNVVVAAHFGGNWPGYRRSANELFVTNLARFLAERELINVVDKQLGY